MSVIIKAVQFASAMVWDASLTVTNLFVPNLAEGRVVPDGCPGAGGKWPDYVSPKEGDSRCSCPALNAMANHGILPRDGKNIPFKELTTTIRGTYNFGAPFCLLVPTYAANALKRDYYKDTFDLADLDCKADGRGIEHDASLTRKDSALVKSQAAPHLPFVEELLASASGKDKEGRTVLTAADLSRFSTKRRVDARETNPHFHLDCLHKIFGSSNSSTLLTIFGGRVDDLKTILTEERLPEGWESRIRARYGLTIMTFNSTVAKVEWGINEKKYRAEKKNA